jgi:tetratricopeptide (TPR) repeat protein
MIALAVALLGPLAAADTIKLVDGTVIDGIRIVSESWKEIEYRKPRVAAPLKVETAKVASIEYSSTSADFREARVKEEEGDLLTAAAYYDAVASDEETPVFLAAEARLRQADVLNENGNLPDAIAAYDQLLKEVPETRHLAEAMLGRGRALLRDGRLEEAAAAFTGLQEAVASKSLGEHFAWEGEFHALMVMQAQGQVDAAARGYEELLGRVRSSDKGIANKCQLRLGRLKLSQSQPDEAKPLFQEIIDSRLEMDKDVVAEAYIGRGRCSFSKGLAGLEASDRLGVSGDKPRAEAAYEDALDEFRDARLDFLRVVVSYPSVKSQQAEAMYWAAQCFLNLAEPNGEREAGRLLKSAAQYPDSPWGKAAAEQR